MSDPDRDAHLCEGCDFLWPSSQDANRTYDDSGVPGSQGRKRAPICPWCGHRHRRTGTMDASAVLALSTAAAVFGATAVFAPIVELSVFGARAGTTIWDGAARLGSGTFGLVAAIVIVTCIALPAIRVLTYAYLALAALAARAGRAPQTERRRNPRSRARQRLAGVLVRLAHYSGDWIMLDIYLCAIGIAAIKLADVAVVDVDIALLALFGAAVCLTALERWADLRGLFRDALTLTRPASPEGLDHPSRAHGLVECATCHTRHERRARCPGCRAPPGPSDRLRPQRLLALTLAGAIAYVPANVLPFVQVVQFGQVRTDTIASGVIALFDDGMWFVAIVVFAASIVVPLAKIAGLFYLGLAAARGAGPTLAPAQGSNPIARVRSRLLDALDATGRWSMIDIFIVVILASVVSFRPAVDFTLGPGAIAFALMVIFTLLATASFDRRLLWRPAHV